MHAYNISLEDFLTRKVGIQDSTSSIGYLDIGDKMGCTGYIDFIKYEDLSHRLMHGYDKYGRFFLTVRYKVYNLPGDLYEEMAITVFQRYSESDGIFCNGTPYLQDNLFSNRLMNSNHWQSLRELIETGKTSVNDLIYECV